MGKPVERITMFKIPEAEGRKKVLDQYKVMKSTAVKVSPTLLPQCIELQPLHDPGLDRVNPELTF
jgi:hypothetical protein